MANAPSRPGVEGVDVFGRSYDWPPERRDGGQCMDCGFLSRRSVEASRPGVEEVPVEDRKAGRLFRMRDGSPAIPWCFALPSSVVDLNRETQWIGAAANRESGLPAGVQASLPESDVMFVLAFDRRCPEWIWYTQTLSPKEHREERNVWRVEEANARTQRMFLVLAVWGVALAVLSIGSSLYPDELRGGIGRLLDWFRLNTGLSLLGLALLLAPGLWLYAYGRGRTRPRAAPRRAASPPR